MARLDVGGIALNVATAGEGPPLLALHGFTGSVISWQRHLHRLSDQSRVIAVDLIGHGGSDAPADPARYSMACAVADLLAVLDRFALPRVDVLGYSMGARLALHLAAAAPRRVGALILESGSPGLAGAEERVARRISDEALATRIERDGVASFIAEWERLPLFATQAALPPDVRDELRRQRLRNDAHGLANSLRGMGTAAQESLWDRLGEIAVPALLIVGARDEKFRAVGRAMAAALPRARLEVIPGAGHAVHLEQPDVFDRIVVQFLAEARQGRRRGARARAYTWRVMRYAHVRTSRGG